MSRPLALAVLVAAAATAVAVAADGPAPALPAPEQTNACAGRSMASFPRAFTNRRNLVVGPLVMTGAAAFTDAATVREFGGNKFPLLVRNGRRVTIELTRRTHRVAALAYAGRREHRVVRFVACARGRESGSDADGEPVTFWSGFVVARRPVCARMRVWVDDDVAPRRAAIPLGRRCD